MRKLKCQHCDKPNPENWFFCRDCGKRASAPKFTTNSFVISEAGKTILEAFDQITVYCDTADAVDVNLSILSGVS